jgi:hypothetical protein
LQLEGGFSSKSEHTLQYDDKHAQRPFIHRLRDHGDDVQPRGGITPK